MLKCLILAYDFPPYTSMGGQRPFGWQTYFKEFGIEPIVVTRQWPEETKSKLDYSSSIGTEAITNRSGKGRTIAVPYKANFRDRLLQKHGFEKHSGLRKLLTLGQSILQHYSSTFDNKSEIYFEARNLLRKEKFDFIIATGEPFILFRYAYKLSKQFKIPWIADYRDCWSDNFVINREGGINKLLHQTYFKSLEKKYVTTASAITTAAPFFQKELQRLFPSKQVSVIYNGFVKEQFASLEDKKDKNNELTIAFAGTIYQFQPVEIFLEGLKAFIQSNPDARIKAVFYGTNYIAEQKKRVLEYDKSIVKYIETTERINQADLFKKMNCADILLLFDNKGMISGKLYEYLALGRFILMAGRDYGSMEEIINQSKAGAVCENGIETAKKLEKLYSEWQSTGSVKCDSNNIEQFSRKEQCKKLANLIKDLN